MPKYFIRCNGKTYGPASVQKIIERVQSGFFTQYSYVSLDRKEWVIITDVEDFESIVEDSPKTVFSPLASLRTKKDTHAPAPAPAPATATASEPAPAPAPAPTLTLVHQDNIPADVFQPQQPNADSIPSKHKSKRKKIIWISAAAAFVLIACAVLALAFLVGHESFTKVSEKYGSAVGLVMVSIKNAQGVVLMENPMGTAFAIDKNLFVTNGHVTEDFNRFKVAQDYATYRVGIDVLNGTLRAEDAASKIDELFPVILDSIENKTLIVNYIVRLNHSDGKTLTIESAAIHPKYSPGGYDIALLRTAETTDTFFPIAKKSKLYSLKPGDEIAYIGFPMEGLDDLGGIDFEKPEASLKTGSINKLSNIHDVFSSSPQENIKITHDLPAVGGSSGSPIFTKNGDVVAILWGVTTIGRNQMGARLPSAAMHNFASRIDILDDVLNQPPIDIGDFIK